MLTLTVRIAVLTRLALLTWAVVADVLLEDYDSAADALPQRPDAVTLLAKPFLRWDAFYFAHIGEHGEYVYEQENAFFPLLPLLARGIGRGLLETTGPMEMVLLGVLISNIAFVLSVAALFKLSELVLRDRQRAFVACVFYCASPAGMFLASMCVSSYALFLYRYIRKQVLGESICPAELYRDVLAFDEDCGNAASSGRAAACCDRLCTGECHQIKRDRVCGLFCAPIPCPGRAEAISLCTVLRFFALSKRSQISPCRTLQGI